MNFNGEKTKALEDHCLNFLNSMGFQVERNNDTKITDIDMKTHDGKYVDFQYSADFNVYGTIRVDYLSTFKPKNKKLNYWAIEDIIRNEFLTSGKELCDLDNLFLKHTDVLKTGKLFEERLSSIVYFMYSKKDSEISEFDIPSAIAIVKIEELVKYIKRNIRPLIKGRNVKINVKKDNDDWWWSSFICIPLSALQAECDVSVIYPKKIKNTLL